MDPVRNPFSPGAGAPPPELVGRDSILEEAKILLARVMVARPEKSIMLTGLRGVGKTVLLNEIKRLAEEKKYKTLILEISEDRTLAAILVPQLKAILFELDRVQGVSEKVKKGLRVLRSFAGTVKVTVNDVTFGLGVDPERGVADSGDLESDLTALFVAAAEAAKERNCGIALLIDELQYVSPEELAALIVAMHKIQQEGLPFVVVGAGLPTLPGLAGDAKSYAERLFSYPKIGALSGPDAHKALQEPVEREGCRFESGALLEIHRLTQGYPYFLQEWGYQAWNIAESSPITIADIESATSRVIPRLDESFFRVRYDRLTPSERKYMRAMAEMGPGHCKAGDIAEVLGVKVTSLGPVRAKLISKGMVYSPAFGEMAFTVPLFDEFMKRAVPKISN